MKDIDLVDLRRIIEVVKESYGYDFSNYAMSSFKRRISRVIDIHNISVETLIEKIKKDRNYGEDFLSEITVNVTEMFRDPSFWKIMREDIIPSILLNHKTFKIWHAGCSSGEEVFSMAINLKEMDLLDKVSIIATDIDEKIINKAKSGIFPLKNMELNGKNYLRYEGTAKFEDYYAVKGNSAIMDPDLVKKVDFRKNDLVLGEPFNKFDLILCRNVMIYFNQTLQNDVLKKFHQSFPNQPENLF